MEIWFGQPPGFGLDGAIKSQLGTRNSEATEIAIPDIFLPGGIPKHLPIGLEIGIGVNIQIKRVILG